MKARDERIYLYQRRTMSNKVNTVFDFIHANWKPWLRLTIYVLLPVAIINAVGFVNWLVNAMVTSGGSITTWSVIGIYSTMAMCFIVANTLFLALMRYYFDHEDGLQSATFATLWRELRRIGMPVIMVGVIFFAVALPLSGLTIFTIVLAPFLFIVYCGAVLNPLMMAPAIIAFENGVGPFDAIGRAFKLSYAEFWKFIGLMILMLLLFVYAQFSAGSILSIVTFLCAQMTQVTFSESTRLTATVVMYLSQILTTLLVMYTYSAVVMAVAFHYGSVAQEHEDADLAGAIDNFDKLD